MVKVLTEQDYADTAEELGVETAAIKAVAEVESAGAGFDGKGRPKILFERHKFHTATHGKWDHTHPGISAPTAGGYGPSSKQYDRFNEAFTLDPEAAMKSASWGKFQILGSNYADAGFESVDEFVDAMKVSEGEHLRAFTNLIRAWGLDDELRRHDWAGFAKRYNGPNYRINAYDRKLADAYALHKSDTPAEIPEKPTTPPPVQIVSSQPPVVEVKSPGTSLATKIASISGPVATIAGATGLKLGGVEFKTGGLVAFAAVLIVVIIVGAWIYDRGKQRELERLKLSVNNLADPNKANVVAGQ